MPSEGKTDFDHVLQRSPKRLRLALELMMKLRVRSVLTEGSSNLENLSSDRPVIFATSHVTDLDVPTAAYAITRERDLGIVDEQVVHDIHGGKPLGYLATVISGKDNYYPIRPGRLDKKSFESIFFAMTQMNKGVMVAAHNPTKDHILPERGGYLAVILAQLTGALVVPIATDIRVASKFIGKPGSSEDFRLALQRPEAIVHIGKPFQLPNIEGFNRWEDMSDRVKWTGIKPKLLDNSNILMRALASNLPAEKRGVWG